MHDSICRGQQGRANTNSVLIGAVTGRLEAGLSGFIRSPLCAHHVFMLASGVALTIQPRMETEPTYCHVSSLSADGDSGALAYLDLLRHEQTRFLDALGAARSLLGGSGGLIRATEIHSQLTRRFFDAQRAILRRRAEHDAAVALMAVDAEIDIDQPDGAEATRQLAELLDTWWRAENLNGLTQIDTARAHADLQPPLAESTNEPRTDVMRVEHLSSDMVAALDAADPADLRSLLAALEGLLEPVPAGEARLEGRPVDDDVIIWLAPESIGLQPIGASWSR